MTKTRTKKTRLTAKVVAWYTLPRDRFREAELKDRELLVDGNNLADIFAQVKRKAIEVFKKQRKTCEALRLTVMFRTDEGVEAKVSYLAETE